MRQGKDKTLVLLAATTANNGAPDGDVGLEMADYAAVMPARDWILTIAQAVDTVGDATYFLYGRLKTTTGDAVWGALGPGGGQINAAAPLSDSFTQHETFNSLGMFERIYLRVILDGAPAGFTTAAVLTAVIEKRD